MLRVWNARKEGITTEEIRQIVLLAIVTVGFPAATRALMWISDKL